MRVWKITVLMGALAAMSAAPAVIACGGKRMSVTIERKTCRAADGVTIVYSACGAGEPELVFIHGGLADRTFWDAQLEAFGATHRVIAVDLAGHGESGTNRTKWGLPEFGADVKSVADAEKLKHMVIFGNSLGGPVAIEAALLMPGRVVGVVGVDTFQSLEYQIAPEDARQRAEAFRKDYAGSVKEMTRALFHSDADPAIVAEAERRMQKTSPDTAYAMFLGLAGYDSAASARRLSVPLRAINGDLYPTDLAGVRKIKPDFDAVIMKHMGHYPMLERPEEFNKDVAEVVAALVKKK
jgi:pimeloyl-ACP methyl ester carboxylesterase